MRKLPFDAGIFIPVLLGMFSVVGLCLVLYFGQWNNSREAIQVSATETPFLFIYLGTKPDAIEPTLEVTETPQLTVSPSGSETPGPSTNETALPSPISLDTVTSIVLPTSTASLTPTLVNTPTPGASVYDDMDFRLVFNGSWIPQDGVPGAYKRTLHVSTTVGDSVIFNFLGDKIQIAFQAGPSLGTVTITLDGLGFTLDQSADTTEVKKWTSGELLFGTHTVVINHSAGGSVNIDSITIPLAKTPTPSPTPRP